MNTLSQMFQEIIERHQEYVKLDGTPYTEIEYHTCQQCHVHIDHPGLCETCETENGLGYQILRKTGRLANGAERDGGEIYHAVRFDKYKAVCGTQPGRRSVGWSNYHGEKVTCQACIKRLTQN